MGLAEGEFLYYLVRALKPETVIETGVASGVSSAHILAALESNGLGRLWSIDLPFSVTTVAGTPRPKALVRGTSISLDNWSPLPEDKEPGWIVPARLRRRWNLELGDSRVLLPRLVTKLGGVDLFLHDSDHDYQPMIFEFATVFPHLRAGGLLVSDDVFLRFHRALPDFAASVGQPYSTFGNMGIIRKGADEWTRGRATSTEGSTTTTTSNP